MVDGVTRGETGGREDKGCVWCWSHYNGMTSRIEHKMEMKSECFSSSEPVCARRNTASIPYLVLLCRSSRFPVTKQY